MAHLRRTCTSSSAPCAPLQAWVESLGGRTSRLGSFEGARGRGLRFQAPVSEGECVASVPLRACLVDLPPPSTTADPWESERVDQEPRLARLADLLAREASLGEASACAPYVDSLPPRLQDELPAPSFTSEDRMHVQYDPCVEQMELYQRRLDASLERRFDHGAHPDDERRFAWAMAAVHSRSFACGRARLLVPFLDLANHAGDATPWHLRDARVSHRGNLQWRIDGPDEAHARVELLSMVSGQPEEALLSYGERSSDHFFAFYGFVPLANPHEDVVLFPGLGACATWMREKGHVPGVQSEAEWEARCEAAEAAVAQVEQLAVEAGERGAVEAPGWKLLADGRVDARMLSAAAALQGASHARATSARGSEEKHAGAMEEGALGEEALAAAREVVVARCEELLRAFTTDLVDDLVALARPRKTLDVPQAMMDEQEDYYGTMLAHYAMRMDLNPLEAVQAERVHFPSSKARLAGEYRVHKKMVLFEALDAGLSGL